MIKCRISELLLASSSEKSVGFQDCCEFHFQGKVYDFRTVVSLIFRVKCMISGLL
jgi:hypothetical protein